MKVFFLNISTQVQGRLVKLLKEFIPSISEYYGTTSQHNIPELIKSIEPDVIIQDIENFSTEELDLLKTIKQTTNTAKILILANYSNIKYKQKCYDLGAELYYDKPSDINKLITEIVNIENSINKLNTNKNKMPDFLERL